jgi:hypothetical protein
LLKKGGNGLMRIAQEDWQGKLLPPPSKPESGTHPLQKGVNKNQGRPSFPEAAPLHPPTQKVIKA